MRNFFMTAMVLVAFFMATTAAMAGEVRIHSFTVYETAIRDYPDGKIKSALDALIRQLKAQEGAIPTGKRIKISVSGRADKTGNQRENDGLARDRMASAVGYLKTALPSKSFNVVAFHEGDAPDERGLLIKYEYEDIPTSLIQRTNTTEKIVEEHVVVQEKSGPAKTDPPATSTKAFIFSAKVGGESLILAGSSATSRNLGYAQVDLAYGRLGIRAYGSYAKGDKDDEFNGEETLLVIGPTMNGTVSKTVAYRLGVLAGIFKDVENYERGEKIKKENQNGAIMPFAEISLTDIGGTKWADLLVEAEGLILLSKDNEVSFQDDLTNGPEKLDTDSFRTGEYGQILGFWRTPLSFGSLELLVGGGFYHDPYRDNGIGAARLNISLSESAKITAEGLNYGGDGWKAGASMKFSF